MYVRMDLVQEHTRSNLEIEDSLVASFEAMNAKLCDQFDEIVLLDFREAYKVDGAQTMADWLTYCLTLDERTAKEYVAVAKALDFLPAIKDAFREGRLSWDQVRLLARFATFAEDVEWSSRAVGMTVAEIRKVAQARIRLTREKADARFKRRYVRARRDVEEGFVNIWARLPDVEGEVFLNAIDRKASVASPDVPLDQRRADALVEICSMAIGADADPDRATVVAHVDLEGLIAADRNGVLEGGTAIAPETVRRLTCDGRLQMVLHTADDIVASRMTRTVPHHLSRELRARDGKCVFPGCSNAIWVDAHHVEHFADGGPTTLDNLLLLCGFHHRLVHEGGWNVFLSAEGDRVFVRPDGRPLFSHAKVGAGRKTLALARAP
jgi:hypothetical protein